MVTNDKASMLMFVDVPKYIDFCHLRTFAKLRMQAYRARMALPSPRDDCAQLLAQVLNLTVG